MLSELFYWVLNINIIGSVAGLVVLSLRKIKTLPRFAVYVLWILPLIRLWIPFGIANEYSLLSLISRFTTKTVVIWEKLPQLTTTNSIMGANSYFPIEYKTDLLENVFSVASVVWIIICCTAIVDKDIAYIILHEQVHIERRDNLFRVIAVITTCVHWFNPLSWIFLRCFFADMELACDAKVLKNLNESQTKEYARTILSCASSKAFFVSAFGGAKTKVRIENILSYRKLTILSSLCFAALVVAIAVIIITNATV